MIHKNALNGTPVNKNSIIIGASVILADLVVHICKAEFKSQEMLEKILTNFLFILNVSNHAM